VWALGRCGRKQAVPILLEQLAGENEALRRSAADALADLTGQSFGAERERWRDWWDRHKDLSNERWLEMRLTYQTSRSHRLEGELERARGQVLHLHQEVYARLPAPERPGHIQTVIEQDDPKVRVLAVQWTVELLSAGGDAARHRALTQILLRLSHDGDLE